MYQEAITSEAKRILDKLRCFPEFYLAGGTALALQLGHRISVDFDFFWKKNIPRNLLSEAEKVFKHLKIEAVVNDSQQLTVAIQGINLTFCRYPFPVISNCIEYQGIQILPSREIAAMKAYVLGRRATLKDYVDLYFVLKGKIDTLPGIIALCEQKYGKEFNTRLFLEQLVYLEDVERVEVQFLQEKVSIQKLETFFQEEVQKINI
ncbi:nucleotidyl transferase AbiEii/AbiGii toxin family protein [Candidatus Aerophobetes bacterium]|nr:nucleotidyl transferase AbiEii/AbiGii toxin family protein [Candidatus Aerophobetes bacterium]